jgi:hypothetical protein
MAPLPLSLTIALWLIGVTWVVALMVYFFDAPGDCLADPVSRNGNWTHGMVGSA